MHFPAGFEKVPHSPGCYLYYDSAGGLLYIGKAKDLKKRVSSYFSKHVLDPKTQQLVAQIASVDFIATNTDDEAFLLENNLIKKNQPKYNINLKDSRRYAYVCVTKERFPRVLLERKRGNEGEYFGPFISAKERDYVIYLINKTFRLRTCRKLPKRACLRKQIGLCDAPCVNAISEADYFEQIRRAKQVLRGDTAGLIGELKEKMAAASKAQLFENARELRDEIASLKRLQEHQSMERGVKHEEDIINYVVCDGRVFLLLFNVRGGLLLDRQEFEFDAVDGWLEDFLSQYYAENSVPNELILPVLPDDGVAEFLAKKAGRAVRLSVPERGEKKDLLELAAKNIELAFFKNAGKLDALKNALSLQELPEVIECFDISHLSGTLSVGSMVQFRRGVPNKSNYRRFKIASFKGNDDYRSIAEVVERRYSRLLREKTPLPNLIIIDGGRGQLGAALIELNQLSLNIPIIGLAKEFEEVYLPNAPTPLRLQAKDPALKFLQEIRDEAHRFAIKYNRLLRSKSLKSQFKENARLIRRKRS